MKMPQRPKPFLEILGSLKKDRLFTIYTQAREYAAADRYLHWDELRRRPSPKGLTHEEWWAALKIRRDAVLRDTPLIDKTGAPFKFSVPDVLAEQLHRIDCGVATTFGLPPAVTNSETRNRYLVNTLMEEAITSSQLEGAVTAYKVAKDMLRTGRKPTNNSERMIVNNYVTMQRIIELRKERLTPELVFELHRLVTRGTLEAKDGEGRFRRAEEAIHVVDEIGGEELHLPPPASELPGRMKAMCAFANAETPNFFIHPAVRAMILHFWLGYDHPFVDGNGRTARALFYWSMLNSGFWLFEFISISSIVLKAPVKYATAFLHSETDGNDLTYFILYLAGVIERAVQDLHAYIDRKKATLRESETRLRRLVHLNHRQKALVLHALKNPGKDYTIEAHRTSHEIVYQTARSDMLSLAQQGLLEPVKVGKTFVFHAPPDLEQRLQPAEDSDDTLPLPLS
jgi:Fic family protein